MNRTLLTHASAVLFAGVIALSGCSSSDDGASSSDPTTTDAVSGDGDSSASSVPDSDAPSGDGYSADDEGSGSVTVDGVKNDGFLGECEISREYGKEDVGELSTEGIEIILAIDNVESNPPEEMNYVVTGTTATFRAAGIGDGMLESIAYVGDKNALGDTTEIGLVAFSGNTDEGTAVTAEVVCVIQNSYS